MDPVPSASQHLALLPKPFRHAQPRMHVRPELLLGVELAVAVDHPGKPVREDGQEGPYAGEEEYRRYSLLDDVGDAVDFAKGLHARILP